MYSTSPEDFEELRFVSNLLTERFYKSFLENTATLIEKLVSHCLQMPPSKFTEFSFAQIVFKH
jgi:hypothetical protein